jgi:hypothetical protein
MPVQIRSFLSAIPNYTPMDAFDDSKKGRTASTKQFPGKLHDMLTYAELHGLDYIVSWVCDGTAFMVHDQAKLVQILPVFFGQTKFRSFQRQLNVS